MLEVFDGIGAAWAEIRHVSEFTGLSIGVLLFLAAVVYLDPLLRKLAVRTAIAVVAAYFLALYAYHLGSADKEAQWTAANVQAAADRKAQDDANQRKLAADFPPPPATDQVSPDEAKILADLAAAAGGACQLGGDALRLRHQ